MSVAKATRVGVVHHNRMKADDGYTLFAPQGTKDVYLIDIDGYVINHWRMPYIPGCHARLLPNGNLFWAGQVKGALEYGYPEEFSGLGGLVREVDWEGNVVWEAVVPMQGHDFQRRENGNVLYICFDTPGILPDDTARRVVGGRPGSEFNGQIWGDCIYEIDPSGSLIWRWLAYEHLDPEIDTMCPLENRSQWPYLNSIWICADGNLLLSTRYLNQATKIAYPSGEVIGRYGRGELAHQHDVRELANGNILAFDNGSHRHTLEPNYSRAVEIDPATDKVVWEYKSNPPSDFYSPICGGAERQENGNTVICDSVSGRIFEVTQEKEIVWEYIVPMTGFKQGSTINRIWRAHRYPTTYPGLRGKNLDPRRLPWENRIYGPDSWKRSYVFSAGS